SIAFRKAAVLEKFAIQGLGATPMEPGSVACKAAQIFFCKFVWGGEAGQAAWCWDCGFMLR
ncbi:MAG: hypothetical protein RLZZ142_1463, partial [Verrucomicrobiota bacterium]